MQEAASSDGEMDGLTATLSDGDDPARPGRPHLLAISGDTDDDGGGGGGGGGARCDNVSLSAAPSDDDDDDERGTQFISV